MPRQRFRMADFSGGRDTLTERVTTPPFRSPNELNCKLVKPNSIQRRNGFTQWVQKTFGTNKILGLYRYIQKDGDKFLMVAEGGRVWACKGDGPHYTDYIEVINGLDTSADVHFAQMQDWCYFTNGVDAPKRWNGSVACNAGLNIVDMGAAGATYTLTPADGTGRMVIDADSNVDYSYRLAIDYGGLGEGNIVPQNQLSSPYGNKTLNSVVAAAGDDGSITLSGLQAAWMPYQSCGAVGVSIYRTTHAPLLRLASNAQDYPPYYFVASTSSDSYEDEKNDTEIVASGEWPGDSLFSLYNDAYAYIGTTERLMKAKYLATHKNRMFWANGYDYSPPMTGGDGTFTRQSSWVWVSELYFPDRIESIFQVDPEDGGEITALVSFRNFLIIFKKNKTYALYGTTDTDLELRPLHPRIGCVAPRTAVVCGDGVLRFLASDGVYAFDGNGFEKLSLLIQPDIDAISASRRGESCAAWHDDKYWLSVSL